MLQDWVISKLEPRKSASRLLLRDPSRLLADRENAIHDFAAKNSFTVIVASTNLVLRDLYETARADKQIEKLLLIDRCPVRRRSGVGEQSPAPLYPDLVAEVGEQGIVDLDLREYLIAETGDPAWPLKIKDATYARLVARTLPGVIRAHKNLRAADPTRFTDHDLAQIVAYAAMGVPDAAFKRNDPESLWRIGLIASTRFGELEAVAPDIVETVRTELTNAPAPYCWLARHDPETVLRAFYTAVILEQHTPEWKLLLPNIDPSLQPYKDMEPKVLRTAPSELVGLSEERAHSDLARAEDALSRDGLTLVFIDRLGGDKPDGFTGIIERERYSTLLRELALFLALRDQLSSFPASEHHSRIRKLVLDPPATQASESPFVERRPSGTWAGLKEAYDLAGQFAVLRKELTSFVKSLGVRKTEQLDFKYFWEQWNTKRLNRCEYYLSAIERAVSTSVLLPRPEDQLPAVFTNALQDLRQRVTALTAELYKQLDEVNRRFQEMVAAQYKSWIHGETNVYLTSQFIPRVLKPNWDPQTEDAVVLVFDGMRYDIFDELLRPAIADRLEVVKEYQGSSVLPSETEVSRWAIAAGQAPAAWWDDARKPENFHLKTALNREFGYTGDAESYSPPGSGTGETVRYKAGRLHYIIFEFCDKELHKITSKTLPDGRQVPSRPLALIYKQLLKDLIDNEVMAVVRQLPAGVKVFITADHGFGRVHRDRLAMEHAWLNQPEDCLHLNAWLRKTLKDCGAPDKVRQNVIEFPVDDLRMPKTEAAYDKQTRNTYNKTYASIVFPKVGYALARPGRNFNPDAFTHGGVSIQELMVPMVVMRVKRPDEGPLSIEQIIGPADFLEGEEVTFRLSLARGATAALFDDVRVDIDPTVSATHGEPQDLSKQVHYVSGPGVEIAMSYRFGQQDATDDERKAGVAMRTLTVAISYRDGARQIRRSRVLKFTVKLNAEQVVRRVGNLGSILGLMPKGMR